MESNPIEIAPQPRSYNTKYLLFSFSMLVIGIFIGYILDSYFPLSRTLPQQTCTPRPSCLDSTPRCMIPETPDMCPPSITPTLSSTPTSEQTINTDKYSIKIPSDWKQIENMTGYQNFSQFQASDGSILVIHLLDSNVDSLTDYLTEKDKDDQTSWEGRPGRKVISTEKTTVAGLPAVVRLEDWLPAGFITVNTYSLLNNNVYSFYIVPVEIPYGQTEAYYKYQSVLDSFEPISADSSFTCPNTEWVDCMPGPGIQKPECQSDYLRWAQDNCPNFQGAAL